MTQNYSLLLTNAPHKPHPPPTHTHTHTYTHSSISRQQSVSQPAVGDTTNTSTAVTQHISFPRRMHVRILSYDSEFVRTVAQMCGCHRLLSIISPTLHAHSFHSSIHLSPTLNNLTNDTGSLNNTHFHATPVTNETSLRSVQLR